MTQTLKPDETPMLDDAPAPILTDNQLHRFARQLILPGFTEDMQIRLAQAHIILIGLGGLGAPILNYLTAGGVGTLTLIDDDIIDPTNLNRQTIHLEKNIGMPKTISAKNAAKAIDSNVTIITKKTRFNSQNATQLCTQSCKSADLIIDASDNPETRYAANRTAHSLGLPLVFGGAIRLEGQVASFISGVDKTAPCYECIFPKPPQKSLASGCSQAGILGGITGIIGSIMALEALKLLLTPHQKSPAAHVLGAPLTHRLLIFDGRDLTAQVIATQKRPDCPCCQAPRLKAKSSPQ